MQRYLIPASILVLALAIFYHAIAPATAATPERAAFCYPAKSVMEVKGSDAVNFAAGATILINKQIEENSRKNFMPLESSSGEKILCAW